MSITRHLSLTALLTLTLTGCGFQLRGTDNVIGKTIGTTQTADNATNNNRMAKLSLPPAQLVMGTSPEDFAVKKSLTKQLSQLGSSVIGSSTALKPTTNANSIANANLPSIQVSNIQLHNYQLRGILTEIRLVLSADVKYHVIQNGKPTDVTNTIQVQRSYQYDQASVSTDNPQAEQIKLWLYDNLAERIADQYLAINLTQSQSTPQSNLQ